MKRHVLLAVLAFAVILLLGLTLTSVCSADEPPPSEYYLHESVFNGQLGPFTFRTYTGGSFSYVSGVPLESWYYSYYPGAPGYNPSLHPGVLDYIYSTAPFSPFYGYNYSYYSCMCPSYSMQPW